jgi:uncharacterized protein YndB with AHSA1/START domain/DNA-binding transcriptional ArsR family regulator
MIDDCVFRALADASRRQLLDRLHRNNGQTLNELCKGLDMSRQAVAKHLAILEASSLVATRRQGRTKLHFINPVPINEIAERWISKFERPRLQSSRGISKERIMTSDTNTSFVYVTFIRTTPETLWSALTRPDVTQQYWFGMHQQTDWKTGAAWRLVFPDGRIADTGELAEVHPPKRLVIKWRNEFKPELKSEGYSRCTIELEPMDGAVKLTVTHVMERAGSKLIGAVSGGWPRILSNLKSLLETGEVALKT